MMRSYNGDKAGTDSNTGIPTTKKHHLTTQMHIQRLTLYLQIDMMKKIIARKEVAQFVGALSEFYSTVASDSVRGVM